MTSSHSSDLLTDTVRAWEEEVIIPTYGIGNPNKNPMFLEKRVYQGSSGVVYPYPVIDRIYDEKEDKTYNAVYLENRYLKIMLLPEIGGRVQMALDKTNGYHFIYYNRVIKPALVGLTGPWISGGIEFNWPQHHRPSTFEPVEYVIKENEDGSQTVWMGEIERMFRTKGMAGFTLYPEKAYLEISVQLYNRTSTPQTFLWWANPAVAVNDDYQSVFPPDVHAVMDHGKRDVSTFPIATGTYYKMDYSPGTDISRYKNIPVPTSYMAYHSDFDFLGCYDHGQQAGMMHVANHHVVPGKKQWTWGNGDFGRAWDRQLTDEDGPYIELMCGAYTDNQPDFSWLQPGEEKRFTQVFMPYKAIGAAKNASKDAVINLEVDNKTVCIGVYVSSPRTVLVQMQYEGTTIFEQQASLTPAAAFLHSVILEQIPSEESLTLRVVDVNTQQELIAYTPLANNDHSIPDPAQPAKAPADIETNEELYLNGLHLEQYRHATYQPEPYYEEALKRDPFDSRCNNAMGALLLRRGKFAEAEFYFRRAIERLTQRNPNPYDGEAYYNLGLALVMQAKYGLAKDAFYKASWNAAWQDSAYFELAKLAVRDHDLAEALDLSDRSLTRNAAHHKARHLKIAVLRHLGQTDLAKQVVTESIRRDCLDFGAYYERFLLDGVSSYKDLMRGNVHNYIELALDYAHAGLLEEATNLLEVAPPDNPMARYYLGWFYLQIEDETAAEAAFKEAAAMSPDYCFPNRTECVPALKAAMEHNPEDAFAPYYLGNFWYGHRCHNEAITCWEQSRNLAPQFPTVHRNLGLAYVNKRGDLDKALTEFEFAFSLDPRDARVLFELDQLHKKRNEAIESRLQRLDAYPHLVEQRDDLTLERITLLNLTGHYKKALEILLSRNFHPWEGGEGKVTGQYVFSLVQLARQKMAAGDPESAIMDLLAASQFPSNLGEGRLANAQHNNIDYYLGHAYAQLGNETKSQEYFELASTGTTEPTSAVYYNDQPPDMIYYQGRARQALGENPQAKEIFRRLVDYGMEHMDDEVAIDYFAVSLPDFLVFDEDLRQRNQIHCHYMMALGYFGLGEFDQALDHFRSVLEHNGYHSGAIEHEAILLQEAHN